MMSVRRFGDGAIVVDAADLGHVRAAARQLLAHIESADNSSGVEDVVVAWDTVTVIVDPVRCDLDELEATIGGLLAGMDGAVDDSLAGNDHPRTLHVPTVFDGPDLEDVAHQAGLDPAQVVDMLTTAELVVAFLGFAPGFAYLHGLPPALAAIPRRPSPRTSVPDGSVALGGGAAAVYPQASPGGWQLVGRSAVTLFDPEQPPFAVLRAGDRVRFTAVDTLPVRKPGPKVGHQGRAPLRSLGRHLVVDRPGALTMVQDAGRIGVAAMGVPKAGSADPEARRVGNRLVGNPEHAAVLEVTAEGPVLRTTADVHIAVIGVVPVRVDGLDVPTHTVVPVASGQQLDIGVVRGGARATVAITGGIEIPPVLGSRSSDLLCGLGIGPLQAGDEVALGMPTRPHGDPPVTVKGPEPTAAPEELTLRVMAGPDHERNRGEEDGPHEGGDATRVQRALSILLATTWAVSTDSNRIGVRLQPEGPPPDTAEPGGWALRNLAPVRSRAMVTGAVQVPPDGAPIILGCDHATVGGFPVLATVVSADHGALGRCAPGCRVRFVLVDVVEARRARSALERRVSAVGRGWYPGPGLP
jgi:KipI family sensor histidine kinase inhibitor